MRGGLTTLRLAIGKRRQSRKVKKTLQVKKENTHVREHVTGHSRLSDLRLKATGATKQLELRLRHHLERTQRKRGTGKGIR